METQNLAPTPASQWKGKLNAAGTDLPLPSGNVARVRSLDPQAFLAQGMIPDPLSQLIRKSINNKKGLPPKELEKIADDPEKLTAALEMFDRVLVHVVLEPAVQMPPPCEECGVYANTPQHRDQTHESYHAYREGARNGEVLYADEVDMGDKMFIFQWCLGGTKDLEKFRGEQAAIVGSLSDGEGVRDTA